MINFSGNVGKSTLSRYVFQPRMENAKVIPVETINSHENDEENIKGKQYGEMIEAMAFLDNAIVDVGSSNVQDFITLMDQYKGSHEQFDYFVVPVINRVKQIRDTIATIDALNEIGISPDKIRLVFNMVDADTDVSKEFSQLFDYYEREKTYTLNPDAVIPQHNFFLHVVNSNETVESLINDKTDINKLIASAESQDEKIALVQKRSLKWLAMNLDPILESAFKATFK
jgi:MinD-like ATPase involved in chromosome partitioning or flagellar assembly